jgi:cbb3-type cytochrome oxidase subunit 3
MEGKGWEELEMGMKKTLGVMYMLIFLIVAII